MLLIDYQKSGSFVCFTSFVCHQQLLFFFARSPLFCWRRGLLQQDGISSMMVTWVELVRADSWYITFLLPSAPKGAKECRHCRQSFSYILEYMHGVSNITTNPWCSISKQQKISFHIQRTSFLSKFTSSKPHFLTKFTFSKSHFWQNSQFQNQGIFV